MKHHLNLLGCSAFTFIGAMAAVENVLYALIITGAVTLLFGIGNGLKLLSDIRDLLQKEQEAPGSDDALTSKRVRVL